MKSGARGLIINIPDAPVMNTQFQFRAGDRYAKEGKDQTAHVMEHLAFGANAKFSDAHSFDEEFTKNGAWNNAWTSNYNMCYIAECADFEWERILELQKLTICSPKFVQSEFDSELGNVKSELTGYLNVPNRVLWPRIGQELGEKNLTWQEKLETLPNITLADIRDHYRRTHTAENMRFVVAGNFSGQEPRLKRILNSFDLAAGERMSVPVDDTHSFESFAIRRKDISNITFGLTINMPRRLSDAESTAMSCMDHILNGTLHGLILGEARKRGLTYDVWSSAGRYEYNSAWDFGGDVNIEKIDELFDLVVEVLKKVKAGDFDDQLLDATKLYGMGRHQIGNQTVGQLANWYGHRYFFDGFVDNFDDSIKRIEAVTKKQIVATVREFFDANIWGLGLYGSTDKATAERLHARVEELFCD